MAATLRVVHCLNQFFGGLGGEEQAGIAPRLLPGARGPGLLLERLEPGLEVVASVVSGDDYVARDLPGAVEEIVALLRGLVGDPASPRPDLLLAGPAFGAGRYGLACGAICQAVSERLGWPAVTGMHLENPGVAVHRRQVVIVATEADVMGMREALAGMVRVGRALVAGEPILPERFGTLPRGLRRNVFAEESGAERAVTLLLRKLRGEPFETEYPLPIFERVAPAPPVDPAASRIALVTSGGIVPRGNPDRIESANASRFGEYPLAGLERAGPDTHESVHGGYDPTFANEDPDRVLPLDAARDLDRAGRIGTLHERYWATVGNATQVERAARFGREIAARLVSDGVQAVILTST